jgi:hypothetical protein
VLVNKWGICAGNVTVEDRWMSGIESFGGMSGSGVRLLTWYRLPSMQDTYHRTFDGGNDW